MTPAEAEEYTRDSYYRGKVFYHGSDTRGVRSIGTAGVDPSTFDEYATYGPGFYVGGNSNIAKDYAHQVTASGRQGAILEIMLNVKKPKVFPNGVAYAVAAENYVIKVGIYSDLPSVDFTE